jgi:hypothetical protein
MREAKNAEAKLTHSFPRKRMRSPMAITVATLNLLLPINFVALPAAPQNSVPEIAICIINSAPEQQSVKLHNFGEDHSRHHKHLECFL